LAASAMHSDQTRGLAYHLDVKLNNYRRARHRFVHYKPPGEIRRRMDALRGSVHSTSRLVVSQMFAEPEKASRSRRAQPCR